MNNDENIWQKPDDWFNKWIKGIGDSTANVHTNILKSIFFFNREKIRQSVTAVYEEITEPLKEPKIRFIKKGITPVDSILHIEEAYVEYPMFRKALTYPHLANEEIITGLLDSDPFLFLNLYEYEFPKVRWHIYRNSGNIEQAEDIFQDALVRILEKVNQNDFDLTCDFGTYLFSVCKNLWYAQLRKQKIDLISTPDNKVDQENKVEYIDPEEKPDDYESIAQAIGNLGENCQKLLNLFYYKQQNWETIAEMLGYSTAANARNQKYKCLERIRKLITDSN